MTTKFKIALASVIALASGSFWFAYANQSKMEVDVSDVTLENIEAFSTTQSLDCEYKRFKNSCTIEFNGNIEIELFEHAVITTKGDGYIIIDGEISCAANGDFACTPIECNELYKIK